MFLGFSSCLIRLLSSGTSVFSGSASVRRVCPCQSSCTMRRVKPWAKCPERLFHAPLWRYSVRNGPKQATESNFSIRPWQARETG